MVGFHHVDRDGGGGALLPDRITGLARSGAFLRADGGQRQGPPVPAGLDRADVRRYLTQTGRPEPGRVGHGQHGRRSRDTTEAEPPGRQRLTPRSVLNKPVPSLTPVTVSRVAGDGLALWPEVRTDAASDAVISGKPAAVAGPVGKGRDRLIAPSL